ncbi:MAG: hypothetical protein CL623_03375 [Arcobacter sp.]|nr:hypothetical protein [Arcobacter sp.]|tara:strand:- start:1420 stop:3837 length:2418 start_codon:yes stop_codon:yes gene_type:complete
MKKLILFIALVYNLFASGKIENKAILSSSNFTNIEKEYISSNKVTFGMLIDYYPFSFKENGKISGFSYDYINLLISKSGLKINIEMDNWTNNLNKFKNKEIDLIDVISYKKDRDSFTNFSKPYFEIPNVIFARKGEINNYTGFESLKGKKVGITKDIYYYNNIKSLGLFELVEFEKSTDKMRALAHEKVDAIFNNLISGQKFIKKAGYSNIKILQELDNNIVKKEDLRIGVKKENEILFSIINKSMEAITREEKETLYNKWFSAKVKEQTHENTISLSDDEKRYLREKKQLNMCIDPDWLPFEKNENGKYIGMSADYFKIFKKSINIPINIVQTKTWSESLKLGQKKECDIFSLIMATPQRVKYLNFTQAYLKTPLVIATNNNELFISNLSELKNRKVGIVKDYTYAEILKTRNPNMNFIYVQNVKEGLEKVENEELFAFIGSLATVGYQLQNNYIGQLKIAGKIDEKLELGVGTRKDEPLLKSIFDKAISKISTEEHQNILNKWVSINYQEGIKHQTMWRYLGILIIITLIIVLLYRQYLLKDLNKKLNEKVKMEINKNIEKNEILAQQSKMAAMGEMIGNIAHQWRQPLSMISTVATGTKMQNEITPLSNDQLNSSLDTINDSAQYLSKTIDDFRNFFNPSNNIISKFYITDTISKALNIIKAQFISKDIEIIEKIENFELISRENELIQVLINILNNARDSLITKEKDRRLIFITTYKIENNIYIEILDNGNGKEEAIINRIFEPYFSTKHKSQGTGIGLYMSEEIVTKHLKGSLSVINEKYTYEGINYTGAKSVIKIDIEV